mgnify:CR=1 FL=1
MRLASGAAAAVATVNDHAPGGEVPPARELPTQVSAGAAGFGTTVQPSEQH